MAHFNHSIISLSHSIKLALSTAFSANHSCARRGIKQRKRSCKESFYTPKIQHMSKVLRKFHRSFCKHVSRENTYNRAQSDRYAYNSLGRMQRKKKDSQQAEETEVLKDKRSRVNEKIDIEKTACYTCLFRSRVWSLRQLSAKYLQAQKLSTAIY